MMEPRTVDFNGVTSRDLNIIFTSVTFGAPSPNTSYVTVPFRHGAYDLSDYYGDITYSQRTHKLTFIIHPLQDHLAVWSEVQSRLNGQDKQITFSFDSGFFYRGRLTVGNLQMSDGAWKFAISALCDPFKYKQTVTTATVTATASGVTAELPNDGMRTSLTVSCEEDIVLAIGDASYGLSAGQHTIVGAVPSGGTTATVTGSGEVILAWQEGRL